MFRMCTCIWHNMCVYVCVHILYVCACLCCNPLWAIQIKDLISLIFDRKLRLSTVLSSLFLFIYTPCGYMRGVIKHKLNSTQCNSQWQRTNTHRYARFLRLRTLTNCTPGRLPKSWTGRPHHRRLCRVLSQTFTLSEFRIRILIIPQLSSVTLPFCTHG